MSAEETVKLAEANPTHDETIKGVVERVKDMVARSGYTDGLVGFRIFVCDFTKLDATSRDESFFTESCLVNKKVPAVIINDRFLLELEAALRSFEMSGSLLGSQYLKSDEDMFGLVERIELNLEGYLKRLRKMDLPGTDGRDGAPGIIDELTMAVLFFVCHEIGHLLTDKDQRSYGTFLNPNAKLEDRITNAVVKLCTHTDDFVKYGFGLPGFEKAAQGDSDVRRVAERYRKMDETTYDNDSIWFVDEDVADRKATELVINYLEAISKTDNVSADRQQYILIKALFVAAIYSWYKDLHTFVGKLDRGWTGNASMLSLEMMKAREKYIHAASLFGRDHRFTLLRATLTMEAILKARTDWFNLEKEKRTIWFSGGSSDPPSGQDELPKWWLSECLQRYWLLCISMDTAVKIAHMGCSTGWIKNADKRRGTPQLFMMQFESIRQAVERLRRFA